VAANLEAMSGYSKDELDKILKENEAELAKLMN
jgi:ribosomal protein L29